MTSTDTTRRNDLNILKQRKNILEKSTMKINFLKLIRKQVTLCKKELFQNKDVSLIDISTLITFIKKLRSSYLLSSLS